jgi:chorismate-pyruvate lyase
MKHAKPSDLTSGMTAPSSHGSALEDPQRLGLKPVTATALDPFIRRLLFDGCMVTRALRDHASAQVKVSVEEQAHVRVPTPSAALLELRAGSCAVRRRVAITIDRSAAPALHAESFVVPDRLPEGFLASLARSTDGIGMMLENLRVPARRDLVGFGLSDGVPWRPRLDIAPVLVRVYRIVADAGPAILINEAFLLEATHGQLRLANVASARTCRARE